MRGRLPRFFLPGLCVTRSPRWGTLLLATTLGVCASFASAFAQGQGQANGIQWTLPGSGDDASFFPCDAGVLHAPLADARRCRFQGTDTSCTKAQEGFTFSEAGVSLSGVTTFDGQPVTTDTEGAHPCACASAQAHRGEFIRYALGVPQDADGGVGADARENEGGVVAGGENGGIISVERLRDNPNPNGRIAASFADPLSEVSFALGSEAFGGQYFLDLCYLGTPPTKSTGPGAGGGGAGTKLPDFSTNAFLTLTNPGIDVGTTPTGGVSRVYESFAGIKGNWDLACSTFNTRGPASDLTTDFRKLGITDDGQRPFPGTLGSRREMYDAPPTAEEGWVGNLKAEIVKTGDFSTLGTQVSTLFGTATSPMALTKGSEGKVPRACRLRLYFWEAASGRTRAWQQGGARFTVKWNVTGAGQ